MLTRILERRRQRLAEEMAGTSERELRIRAADLPPPRDFRAALDHAAGLGLIAEIKRATPSRGPIALALDPAERARAYQAAGADCLSVLTEPDFFRGSADDLRRARAACALPILRKDFLVDPWQVWEARAMGADAVLLIVAALDGARMREMRDAAREAGLHALVEVHTAEELAGAADADLIGVNSRNLRTLEISLDTMVSVLNLVPKRVLAVAESGLRTGDDARRARAAGARALLVGEEVVTRGEPAGKIRELKLLPEKGRG